MTSHYEPPWPARSGLFGDLGNALLVPSPLPMSLVPALMLARLRLLDPPINHANAYLRNILRREAVDTSLTSPLRKVQTTLLPVIRTWANGHLLSVEPSGSFAKGTANTSGTDIDLFVSVSPNVVESLGEIYDTLERALRAAGYKTRRQNVSINITVDGQSVDLVPAKRQNLILDDHSLYRRKADTWTKTNVATHAWHVSISGRTEEIRIIKLWRDQLSLEWPSFYLELTVIRALRLSAFGDLAENVSKVFEFLRDDFLNARIEDPANSNNIISDDLNVAEKSRIKAAGARARATQYWRDIVV
jgi:hypothetical protein